MSLEEVGGGKAYMVAHRVSSEGHTPRQQGRWSNTVDLVDITQETQPSF